MLSVTPIPEIVTSWASQPVAFRPGFDPLGLLGVDRNEANRQVKRLLVTWFVTGSLVLLGAVVTVLITTAEDLHRANRGAVSGPLTVRLVWDWPTLCGFVLATAFALVVMAAAATTIWTSPPPSLQDFHRPLLTRLASQTAGLVTLGMSCGLLALALGQPLRPFLLTGDLVGFVLLGVTGSSVLLARFSAGTVPTSLTPIRIDGARLLTRIIISIALVLLGLWPVLGSSGPINGLVRFVISLHLPAH